MSGNAPPPVRTPVRLAGKRRPRPGGLRDGLWGGPLGGLGGGLWDGPWGRLCFGLACLAALAGCATPRISVTDASPLGIRFLVRDTLLVPWGVVDEQAASHCGQHDMAYRRAGSEHTVAGSLVLNYDCVPLADTRRAEVRRTPPRQAGGDKAAPAEARAAPLVEPATPPTPAPADPKPAVADSKAAAWQKAKTATDAWALCLERGAERRAREADDPPQVAAQAVLDGCSRLERAVHEPLRAAGEDTPGFQTDLHTQAVQRVSQTIVRTRQKANGPVAVGEHVGDPAPEAR